MFAPSFRKAARSTSCISSACAVTFGRAGLKTAQIPFRPAHQRRYSSSSKPSIPPSSKKKPVDEVEQSAATQLADAEPSVEAQDKTAKTPAAQLPDAEAGLETEKKAAESPATISMYNIPHVPATTHNSRGTLSEVMARASY